MLATLTLAAVVATTSYRVAMPDPTSHFFKVEVRFENVKAPLRFAFPAFSPGGWKIDEVAGNVLDLAAVDGGRRILPANKIDKQTWEIGKPKDGTVVVAYRVYANERGTAYAARLNTAMAHANFASILGYAPERQRAPTRLALEPFGDWKVACSLAPDGSTPLAFTTPDFDQLADGIFLAGNFTEIGFDDGGARYRLAFSRAPDFKDRKVGDDVQKIVHEAAAVFGETPFDRYLFLYVLEADGGHGGIEHSFGTSMCAPLESFEDREAYRKLLGLTAHEFVHAWNVKRMRPAGLGPFDFTKESPTHNLYVAEGFTSYYGNVVAVRGGATTREEYFKALAEGLVTDRGNAGIRAKSLEDHSWDWWLPSGIPYLTYRTNYTRGSLVALVLDLEIRNATGGARSLDDVMRSLYGRTGKRATGYTDAELRYALVRDGAPGMDARLDAMVTQPGSLDTAAALALVGVEVVPDPASPALPFFGWRTGTTGKDFPAIDWVEPGSPAAVAGLQDRDLIVALGDRRLSAERIDKELVLLAPGTPVAVSFFRDGTLRRVDLIPGAPVPPKLIVRQQKDATPEQKNRLDAWLGALPATPTP
jgi:predicted metalloprotease with PDZ domain